MYILKIFFAFLICSLFLTSKFAHAQYIAPGSKIKCSSPGNVAGTNSYSFTSPAFSDDEGAAALNAMGGTSATGITPPSGRNLGRRRGGRTWTLNLPVNSQNNARARQIIGQFLALIYGVSCEDDCKSKNGSCSVCKTSYSTVAFPSGGSVYTFTSDAHGNNDITCSCKSGSLAPVDPASTPQPTSIPTHPDKKPACSNEKTIKEIEADATEQILNEIAAAFDEPVGNRE